MSLHDYILLSLNSLFHFEKDLAIKKKAVCIFACSRHFTAGNIINALYNHNEDLPSAHTRN